VCLCGKPEPKIAVRRKRGDLFFEVWKSASDQMQVLEAEPMTLLSCFTKQADGFFVLIASHRKLEVLASANLLVGKLF